ncbi:MAG TPA: redox-sensing transcriptional repressor Rex [Candidatus Pygmaiobacter gallistercoris]|nr:redox-sensing transcriptional repressor Rex [Candidatus Pygmaiobacter gallistercoris]
MSMQNKPSLPVIKRLPRYYRYLGEMEQSGVVKVSSSELARMMGTTASQVRQDFNCFGGFGQQGIGYNVKLLREELGKLLFGRRPVPTVLIGAGNLGHAMANYLRKDAQGFALQAAFDVKPEMVGLTLCDVPILDMKELGSYCAEHRPKVAVICVPREAAAQVARQLIDLGVRAFWNFSHYDFSIEFPDVVVENVHLGDSLATLSYEVNNNL